MEVADRPAEARSRARLDVLRQARRAMRPRASGRREGPIRERGDSWPEVEELRDARRAELAPDVRHSPATGRRPSPRRFAIGSSTRRQSARAADRSRPERCGKHRITLRRARGAIARRHPARRAPDPRRRGVVLELSTRARRPRKRGRTRIRTDVAPRPSRLRRAVDRAVRLELVETNVVAVDAYHDESASQGSAGMARPGRVPRRARRARTARTPRRTSGRSS